MSAAKQGNEVPSEQRACKTPTAGEMQCSLVEAPNKN